MIPATPRMNCPQCGSVLESLTWESNVKVDQCPACRGVWLDKGELERIEELVEHDYSHSLRRLDSAAAAYELARQKTQAERPCPQCQQSLEKEEYGYCSEILIDHCAECGGVWLDRGELEALETFFERERADIREEDKRAGLFHGFLASLTSLFK